MTEEKTKTNLDDEILVTNPLLRFDKAQLLQDVDNYVEENGLSKYKEDFRKGALIAQYPNSYNELEELSDEDKNLLTRELTHKWSHPFTLYWLVGLISMVAVIQGMDETVVNGAQIFYSKKFDINRQKRIDEGREVGNVDWILGLVNAAPYICCAVLGSWLTDPLNRYFGRRGCIFIATTISAIASIWEGVANSWPNLFAARFVLGLAIGPNSSCAPVYAAEAAPPNIRGALVMSWQMWTAFGIALGYVVTIAFYFVPDTNLVTGLNWRLMLGSTVAVPIFVLCQVYSCPESPRWYISKNRHVDAFESLCRLRNGKVQAARDLYYMQALIKEEQESRGKSRGILDLILIARNRRAVYASSLLMFMQQFCGINVIAYYSSQIFLDAGFGEVQALCSSLGFGLINWVFAFPAFFTIDTFGRRNLLLSSFPLMGIFLIFTGACFKIPEGDAKLGCIILGIYLHCAIYSVGEGPVPFTYSAECYPLAVRNIGMSWATVVCWLFNSILALTWPSLLARLTPTGAFCYYGGWCFFGFFMIYFILPETKSLSLEELDRVFSLSTSTHAKYYLDSIPYYFQKYLLLRDVKRPELYVFDNCAPDSYGSMERFLVSAGSKA